MISLITPARAQRTLAKQARERRLQLALTQAGLAVRSGVALPTLRKFERTGILSLASFLKLHSVLGGLDGIIQATQPQGLEHQGFRSIRDVIRANERPVRKRGTRD